MMRNVRKSGLENFFGWLCVGTYVHVLRLRKFQPSVSQESLTREPREVSASDFDETEIC